jgi:type III restriction enzyme
VSELTRWLDKELKQHDVQQAVMLGWIGKALAYLIDRQKFDLATLGRAKFILVRALAEKIAVARKKSYAKGYQETLFAPQAAVETSFHYAFSFQPNIYPANWFYKGGFKFKNHYYPVPGELEGKGEEFECAQALDWLPGLKHWVRNLDTRPNASFWLPTSTDRFYPDFVAALTDGRLLVVEYKGSLTAQTQDTQEKRAIGELWESKSGGNGLFLIVEKKDQLGRGMLDQLKAKIARV